ncbi:Hypothetical protein, putative [Bodo saltans]|uniref:Uncharacterized protein n=1 Tax=Bodo saltans TaxID=75058 RepID=A0A0S4JPE2_BODSA|nr:Hypothetical protein, putative [Bodo saltans]|eukprot:CUG93406.1 Hypothetical protein, putative [Bodo saltans]
MSHIADLHNNGRCGQLRTVESARGAYADLIRKEHKAADSAARRDAILSLNITCPRCALVVCSARCNNCHYFPIPLPDAIALDSVVAQRKSAAVRGPSAAVSQPVEAVEKNVTRQSSTPSSSDRLDRLQKLIVHERDQRIAMLERVKELSVMVGQLDETKLRRK